MCIRDSPNTNPNRNPNPTLTLTKVGLVAMNALGQVVAVAPQLTPDTMLVQMGGFAQIYSGGVVNACRHAVLRQSAEAGVARATYCNFWYAPWDLLCVPAGGAREAAVSTGWNPNPNPNPNLTLTLTLTRILILILILILNPNPNPNPKRRPPPGRLVRGELDRI